MHPRIEATTTLENRLADVVMAQLLAIPYSRAGRPRRARAEAAIAAVEIESERDAYYASYVVLRGAVSMDDTADATIRISREPMADFVTTSPFMREPLDADDDGTARFVRYSAPYERIDLEHAPLAPLVSTSSLSDIPWFDGPVELIEDGSVDVVFDDEPADARC